MSSSRVKGLKTLGDLLRYVNLVLWQHVVSLCVSRTVFRMSLKVFKL